MRCAGVGLLSVVLLSVLLFASRPARSPQSEPAKATISGRVIGAENGTPQRDARVTLSGSALERPRTSSTDDNGAYRFADVPAGRYLLTVTPSPHRPGHLGTARRLGPPASPVVDVRPGQARDDVDVELAPAAVISGRVIDQAGATLSDVSVVALGRRTAGLACSLPMAWATTDDRGEFRLAGLEPGDYCVRATGLPTSTRIASTPRATSSERPEAWLPTFHPGTTSPDEAVVVAVASGQARTAIDVQLQVGPVYRITGLVTRADGSPAAAARLSIVELHDGLFTGSVVRAAQSDGRFELNDLAPGEYVVRASPADASGARVPEASAATWIGLSTADVENLLVSMTTGVVVTGQIVTDDGAVPPFAPRGLEVTAQEITPGPVPFSTRAVGHVDDDWRFEIDPVRGASVFRTRGTLPAGWHVTAVRYRGADVSDEPIEIARTSAGDLEVVIGRGGARLSGIVTDSDRRPAPGRTVVIFPAEPARQSSWSLGFRVTSTDEAGRYVVEGLPRGDYLATAVDASLEPAAFDGRRAFDGLVPHAREVTFHAEEPRTLDLTIAGPGGN